MKRNMLAVVCLACFLMFTPFLHTTKTVEELIIVIDGKRLVCCKCGCKEIRHVIGRNGNVLAYCDRCIKSKA